MIDVDKASFGLYDFRWASEHAYRQTAEPMFDLKWTSAEKKVAHAAFEAALSRERATIRHEIESILRASDDGTEIWRVRDYLNDKARELDRKYDFRYSVLIRVFAQLLAEGWLTLDDIAGLNMEKQELIREHSTLWRRDDA